MPYADSAGVRIHYQIEGQGPPLVLHHWSLATLESWYDHGYVSALGDDYRLILIDARGHGASDKPHAQAAYALENRVVDIVAVLDDLGIAQAHYFGYSMGGWIGLGITQYAPDRFRSLVIGGAHPFDQSMEGMRQILLPGLEQGPGAVVDVWEENFGPLSPEVKQRWLTYDCKALMAVAQDRESQEMILPAIRLPCLIYAGEADGIFPLVKASVSQIPDCTFVTLPGLDHGEAIRRSDLVVPHVKAFLAAVDGRVGGS